MKAGCALKKVAVDQIIFAPIEIVLFLAYTHFTQKSKGDFTDKINEDLKEIVINNWKLWLPAQFINFKMIPEQHRVLFTALVGVTWMTYLSYAAHNPLTHN